MIYDMAGLMDFYDFIELDDRGKAFAIWHYGIFLLSRRSGRKYFKLYAISDFYVEVLYRSNKIDFRQINTYETTDFLEAYLDLVDISQLTDKER